MQSLLVPQNDVKSFSLLLNGSRWKNKLSRRLIENFVETVGYLPFTQIIAIHKDCTESLNWETIFLLISALHIAANAQPSTIEEMTSGDWG